MRCLLKASIPVETGNTAMADGSFSKTIESFLTEFKPESAYFLEENGHRTAFIFLEVKDPSQIPAIAEPWFLAFNAQVEFHPAMIIDDLKKAAPAIERALKNHHRKERQAA
jgi:hypothetical protein